jgi:hypothetical protein|tara:strand:+ start:657 stop:854 length:198 start_codon:yes stop_codon:yes gene_type:complete
MIDKYKIITVKLAVYNDQTRKDWLNRKLDIKEHVEKEMGYLEDSGIYLDEIVSVDKEEELDYGKS